MKDFIKINHHTILNREDIELISMGVKGDYNVLKITKKDGNYYYIEDPALILNAFSKTLLNSIQDNLYNHLLERQTRLFIKEVERRYRDYKHELNKDKFEMLKESFYEKRSNDIKKLQKKLELTKKVFQKMNVFTYLFNESLYNRVTDNIKAYEKQIVKVSNRWYSDERWCKELTSECDTITDEDKLSSKYLELYNNLKEIYLPQIKELET